MHIDPQTWLFTHDDMDAAGCATLFLAMGGRSDRISYNGYDKINEAVSQFLTQQMAPRPPGRLVHDRQS